MLTLCVASCCSRRQPSFEVGELAPYLVELDDSSLFFVMIDEDKFIRAAPDGSEAEAISRSAVKEAVRTTLRMKGSLATEDIVNAATDAAYDGMHRSQLKVFVDSMRDNAREMERTEGQRMSELQRELERSRRESMAPQPETPEKAVTTEQQGRESVATPPETHEKSMSSELRRKEQRERKLEEQRERKEERRQLREAADARLQAVLGKSNSESPAFESDGFDLATAQAELDAVRDTADEKLVARVETKLQWVRAHATADEQLQALVDGDDTEVDPARITRVLEQKVGPDGETVREIASATLVEQAINAGKKGHSQPQPQPLPAPRQPFRALLCGALSQEQAVKKRERRKEAIKKAKKEERRIVEQRREEEAQEQAQRDAQQHSSVKSIAL